MPKSVKLLCEERAPLGKRIRELADKISTENRDFTPEEKKEWDDINKRFNECTAQIDSRRAALDVDGELGWRDPNPPGLEDGPARRGRADREEVGALAVQGWLRHAHGLELREQHKAACRRVGVNPRQQKVNVMLPRRPESRALSVGVNGSGGYTVPTGFVPQLESAMRLFNPLRTVADVVRTPDGRALPWPTSDDTSNTGELLGENTQAAEQDVTFSQITLGAYKYSSKLVRVSSELLEDSAIVLADELSRILGERIGRVQAPHFTTGTGTGQPQGVVTGATLGATAASTTTFTADEVLDLIHSIDPAYRQDPSFALMCSDPIMLVLHKMKDGNSRYLFTQQAGDAASGFAGRVHGVPVILNPHMSGALTTGQKVLLAGAFRYFKIRDVAAVRFARLTERYAELDQTGFLMFVRSDSKVLDAGTRPIKYLALA